MRWNLFFGPLVRALFPPRCAGCNTIGKFPDGICGNCRSSIPFFYFAYCPACKRRIAEPPLHRHAAYTLVAVTNFRYPPVQNIIHTLKYRRQRALAKFCGELMAESVFRFINTFHPEILSSVILPIPLHPRRLRERGFNQSEEIADVVTKQLAGMGIAIPVFTDILLRTHHTLPQAKCGSKKERISNLKRCFSATGTRNITGKTVFLIDDVSTTGTTLHEATAALRSAGARHVIAFVFAKTD